MSNYARANTTAQWYEDTYPGSTMSPNVLVVHTTEGLGWPGYDGGAVAPNYTANPNMATKRLDWRAHFPDERSARALVNAAGGVETNTLNAVQVELVGTCDPAHREKWGGKVAGVHYIYWPEAPEWALAEVAAFVRDMHVRHGIKLQAPKFLAYPASYGASPVRFTFAQWRSFYGICGHQHVPENHHGDPGNIDMPRILALAGAESPAPRKVTRGSAVDRALDLLRKALARAKDKVRRKHLQDAINDASKIPAK